MHILQRWLVRLSGSPALCGIEGRCHRPSSLRGQARGEVQDPDQRARARRPRYVFSPLRDDDDRVTWQC
jgi:hypothetical protein